MSVRMMHIGTYEGQVGKYVILPERQEDAAQIALRLSSAAEVAFNREFRTFTGEIHGTAVSVTSSGIGGPSVAIAAEELRQCGAQVIIRVTFDGEGLIIPNGAVAAEGVSRHYVPVEFPPVPDLQLVELLVSSAPCPSRTGVSVTVPHKCAPGRPMYKAYKERMEIYRKGGALITEYGDAALFSVGRCLGMRVASVHGKESVDCVLKALERLVDDEHTC